MRVLLIEDSVRLQRSITMGLKKEGYRVDASGDGEEGLWYIESFDYDVVILDIMLPGLDGLSLLNKIREKGNTVHVLILSARDTLEDRVKGLETGADDYLVKPFAFQELLARVQALVRRKYTAKSNIISVGDLEIDLNRRLINKNNRPVNLPPREFLLLEYLVLNKGKAVSRTSIEEHIYDEKADPFSNVIDAAVCSLRKKIDIKGEKSLIKTIRGYGYIIE
jgi:DNA-binding response OmpR family regulator